MAKIFNHKINKSLNIPYTNRNYLLWLMTAIRIWDAKIETYIRVYTLKKNKHKSISKGKVNYPKTGFNSYSFNQV